MKVDRLTHSRDSPASCGLKFSSTGIITTSDTSTPKILP